ncbi:hypothetical protein [Sphingomonas sp. Mn802worker]|uniref:hypothetical protein n=1 Tax=Sphingomonas sp. Mn802worker TaxID=629773 RepID=UPI0003A431DB|nr:hypothetical protein [Sphingomonas sp. Mn802worker]
MIHSTVTFYGNEERPASEVTGCAAALGPDPLARLPKQLSDDDRGEAGRTPLG